MKVLQDVDFEKEVKGVNAAVVEFYSPTCSHCKIMQKVLEQAEGNYEGQINFYGVDITEAAKTAAGYDIVSVPTFLFIKNGEVKDKMVGEVHKLILEQALNKLK